MSFWCWIGFHDWEQIRRSFSFKYGEHDYYAMADLYNHFPDIMEKLKDADCTIPVPYGKNNERHRALKLTGNMGNLRDVPTFTDDICKACNKSRLKLTKAVAKRTSYYMTYESKEIKESRKKKLEMDAKALLAKRIKTHPVETY